MAVVATVVSPRRMSDPNRFPELSCHAAAPTMRAKTTADKIRRFRVFMCASLADNRIHCGESGAPG